MWFTLRWKRCRRNWTKGKKKNCSRAFANMWKAISGRSKAKPEVTKRFATLPAVGRLSPVATPPPESLHGTGAMSALFRLNGNWHRALRALFGRHRRRRFWKPLVHRAHQQEHREGDDNEIDDGVQKISIIKRWRARGFCRCQRIIMLSAEIDEEARKIHLAHQPAEWRHQQIVDQRGYHASKRRSDNHADRQVQHVAPHGEFFEFFQHESSPLPRSHLGR